MNVWKGIPFYVLLLLAGLKAVDREQLEAAEVDGASAVQRFRHVTLPAMRYVDRGRRCSFVHLDLQPVRPALPDDRGRPWRRDQLYSILAYEKAIGSLQYGPGTAIALSVAPLMAVLIWLLAKFMRTTGRSRQRSRPEVIGDRSPARRLAPGAGCSTSIVLADRAGFARRRALARLGVSPSHRPAGQATGRSTGAGASAWQHVHAAAACCCRS